MSTDRRSEPNVRGISMTWRFESPAARIAEYRCLCSTRGLTAEREQFWDVIGFPQSGQYVLSVRGRSVLIDPTCVAFFSEGVTYRTNHPSGMGDRGVSLIIRPDILREMMESIEARGAGDAKQRFPFSHAHVTARVSIRMALLFQAITSRISVDTLAVEELSLYLAGAALAAGYQQARPGEPPSSAAIRQARERAEAVRILLARNPSRRWRLDDLAKAVEVSPFRLCRLFRAETGMPIKSYIRRLRLAEAVARLRDGQRDLSAIALDLGFSSHSHFTADFRREYGLTPSETRRLGEIMSDKRRDTTLSRKPDARF